jgi:hypothetical protein
MLPRLVDHGGSQQLRWIEIADGESFQPRLVPARQAMKLCATDVPQLDVDTVGAALTEEKRRHRTSLAAGRRKGKMTESWAVLPVLDNWLERATQLR